MFPSVFFRKKDIPNLLTSLRLFSGIIIYILLVQEDVGYYVFAFFLFAFAALTDYYDGKLARRWNCASKEGHLFDPIADKVLFYFVCVALYSEHNLIPLWFLIVMFVRDVLVSLIRASGVQTTWYAKVKMTAQFILLLIGILLAISPPTSFSILFMWDILVGVVALFTLLTLVHYFYQAFREAL